MTKSDVLLVANPTAQSGKNLARIEKAKSLFAKQGIACELLSTLPHGGTIGAVVKAIQAGSPRTVVAMGGDGTFREVAAGILDSGAAEEIAMGMLPTGTANDQGRSFGLEASPTALARNVEVIAHGRQTRLDAGRLTPLDHADVSPAWFFDSLGWGISARVLAERNRDREVVEGFGPLKEIYRDHAVYAGALLKVFLESYVVADKMDVTVQTGEETTVLTGLTDLIVKATRIYGGAWIFDRTSKHDDGLFEVVPFRGKRDWTSKAIVDLAGNPITEEMLNAVGIAHSHPFRIADAELRISTPHGGAKLAAQIDGEEFAATAHARIEVRPRALRLIVP
jgi:diacylglycerol kinase family enzyme